MFLSNGSKFVWSGIVRASCLAAALLMSPCLFAAAGDLDSSFGSGGLVSTAYGTDDKSWGVLLLPNGGLLIAGSTLNNSTALQRFALVRYTAAGALDRSFGANGVVATSPLGAPNSSGAACIAAQPDGKIILAGATQFDGTNWETALVRYNADGSLDPTFGTNGVVVTRIGGTSETFNGGLLVQPDGKIVAVGSASIGSYKQLVIARYNSNGTLDSSFGTRGIVQKALSGYDLLGKPLALQPDGKMVVAAAYTEPSDGLGRGSVTRYNVDGSVDTSFGTGGSVVLSDVFPNARMGVNNILRQPDGKLVIVGAASLDNTRRGFAVARLRADGSVDSAFGTGGLVSTAIGSQRDSALSVVLQPDGRILAGGRSMDDSGRSLYGFAVARYNANGSLDASFGAGGFVRTVVGSLDDEIYGMVIAPDGKIVVTGMDQYDGLSGSTKFVVARYLGDSSSASGLWWNENESGWGMSVTQHGAMIFNAFYTYDQAGTPVWYVMSSCPVTGYSCTGPIYQVRGGTSPALPWNGAGAVLTSPGTGTLAFADASNATFSFTLNGITGTKTITRQVFATGNAPPPVDYTDLWWNANESGWGVAISQEFSAIFATWYAYDDSGNAVWYVASNCPVVGNGCTGDLYKVSGGSPLTGPWNGNNKVVTKVGSASFAFANANAGTLSYSINGATGNRSITRQPF